MLVDTGASVSLLPIELMESLEIKPSICLEHRFTGVMQRDEYKVPAKIYRLMILLKMNGENIS